MSVPFLERWREGEQRGGLLSAALLMHRAGLTHLVQDPDAEELAALVRAGEIVAHERAELVALAIEKPDEFAARLDGGDRLLEALLGRILAAAVERRKPRAEG